MFEIVKFLLMQEGCSGSLELGPEDGNFIRLSALPSADPSFFGTEISCIAYERLPSASEVRRMMGSGLDVRREFNRDNK